VKIFRKNGVALEPARKRKVQSTTMRWWKYDSSMAKHDSTMVTIRQYDSKARQFAGDITSYCRIVTIVMSCFVLLLLRENGLAFTERHKTSLLKKKTRHKYCNQINRIIYNSYFNIGVLLKFLFIIFLYLWFWSEELLEFINTVYHFY
jgi:Fe2+ transport system protein B